MKITLLYFTFSVGVASGEYRDCPESKLNCQRDFAMLSGHNIEHCEIPRISLNSSNENIPHYLSGNVLISHLDQLDTMKCGWAQCAQLPRAATQNTVWLLTWLSAAATVRKLGATFLRSLPLITDQVQVCFPYKCFVCVSRHPEMNHIYTIFIVSAP